jgi:hypothetical protein
MGDIGILATAMEAAKSFDLQSFTEKTWAAANLAFVCRQLKDQIRHFSLIATHVLPRARRTMRNGWIRGAVQRVSPARKVLKITRHCTEKLRLRELCENG